MSYVLLMLGETFTIKFCRFKNKLLSIAVKVRWSKRNMCSFVVLVEDGSSFEYWMNNSIERLFDIMQLYCTFYFDHLYWICMKYFIVSWHIFDHLFWICTTYFDRLFWVCTTYFDRLFWVSLKHVDRLFWIFMNYGP